MSKYGVWPSMNEWDDWQVFLAAFEAGTFTDAAAVLGVGQATVSRRVARLERRVGHVLFDRNRGGLEPSPLAVAMRPWAEAMATAAQEALAVAQDFETQPEGVVRLAVPPGVAVDLVPPLLPILRQRHPGIRLEVLSHNRTLDLERRAADIAVRGMRPERGDLVWRRLPDVRLGVFGSAELVASLPAELEPSALPWVQYEEGLLHIPTAQMVEGWRGSRPPVFTSNSFLALRAAAAHGIGVVLLPDMQARLAGLVEVPGFGDLPSAPWYLVTPRALQRVPRVALVVEFLVEAVTAAMVAGAWPPPIEA
jgi:DNA-binding transcriptional LysR family regulator